MAELLCCITLDVTSVPNEVAGECIKYSPIYQSSFKLYEVRVW